MIMGTTPSTKKTQPFQGSAHKYYPKSWLNQDFAFRKMRIKKTQFLKKN